MAPPLPGDHSSGVPRGWNGARIDTVDTNTELPAGGRFAGTVICRHLVPHARTCSIVEMPRRGERQAGAGGRTLRTPLFFLQT